MGMASSSYGLGDVMRRLLVRFEIVPVQRIDTGYVRPRVLLTLRIPVGADTTEDIEHEIDLFDPPVEIKYLDDCVTQKTLDPNLTLREIGHRLGINYMAVKRSLALHRELQNQGLESPYVRLFEIPESAPRWTGRGGG